jgi:hypothetical protein
MVGVAALVVGLLSLPRQADGAPAVLTTDGRAVREIVVAAAAVESTRATAELLADYLQRISGAKFTVRDGDGSSGVAVGLPGDFPATPRDVKFDPSAAEKREDYLLRSHPQGVWVMGATEQALRHAAWDLLHRLGYRQYFPGGHWEIIPQRPSLTLDVDAWEHPSYYSRRIWYGYGAWDHAREPYRDWCEKNRCVEGIRLNTGHAYDGILTRNKAAFAEHPEYLGLVRGERRSTKFCISNPGLRKLVVDDALAQLAKEPTRQSVSVDPSDGGGWCECPECAKLGSVTDRALTLANAVAQAVTQQYPDKYVGMYAYNEHSPPPSIAAHPHVVISVATAFIHGGFTVDQLLDGWAARASILGIREYYSVNTWDRDLPGAARGGRLEYLRTTIPHFYEKSARFLSAESSDNWGPNGLGYYLAARMLWDVREAARMESSVAEFLELCFGPAREPMKKFYGLLDGAQRYPLCDDLVGRMYRWLDEARRLTTDAATQARLDDLTLYTRYVELWLDYSIASGPERQAAFEAMIRHAYRMRGTMLIHTLALYRDVDSRDKSVSIPESARFSVPEGKNPWKSSEPFATAEVDRFRSEGIARRPLLDFTPVSFSNDLVPAAPLKLNSSKAGSMGIYSRSPRSYFTWVDQPPHTWTLSVTGGTVYRDRGATKLELYPAAEAEGKSVAQAEVAPTRTPENVRLTSSFAGLHRVEILAGGGAQTLWDDGVPMTIESSFERPGNFHGRWTLYFYVPKGTRIVGGFSNGEGKLRSGSDVLVHTFDRKPGFFSVPVPAGEDGRLWRFEGCAGDRMLMTVPPFLARSASELLLPREVVERDAAK